MNSQLDIINEQDKIIGKEDIEEIHQKELLHRSVHVLFINNQGQFYLRRRSKTKARYPGFWTTSIGAHVMSGQTYDEVAKMSLKDMNLDGDLKFLGKVRVHDEYENEISYTYAVDLSEGEQVKSNPEEPGKFLTIEEIKNIAENSKMTSYVMQSIKLYYVN